MPNYVWITPDGESGDIWAPTIQIAEEDVRAETGWWPSDIWDAADEYDDPWEPEDYNRYYVEDWSYGGTD